jgi:hypothetical protein
LGAWYAQHDHKWLLSTKTFLTLEKNVAIVRLGSAQGQAKNYETVSICVDDNHTRRQRKRVVPCEALFKSTRRYWRRADKNPDG